MYDPGQNTLAYRLLAAAPALAATWCRGAEHFRADNVLLLGEEKAAALTATADSAKLVAQGYDQQTEHDVALACLFEALGRMADQLQAARSKIAELEQRLKGDVDRDQR